MSTTVSNGARAAGGSRDTDVGIEPKLHTSSAKAEGVGIGFDKIFRETCAFQSGSESVGVDGNQRVAKVEETHPETLQTEAIYTYESGSGF
jgi:hypothetical protein